MSDQSGGGGIISTTDSPPEQQHHNLPGQVSSGPAWAGALGGAKTINSRTFAQIIEEEKATRNIIEIHLSKQNTEEVTQNNSFSLLMN